jgi:hypothetical protein
MQKDLQEAVEGVEEGSVRSVGRRVGEPQEGAGQLGTPRTQDLDVPHLGQGKIGNPVRWLDRNGSVGILVSTGAYLGR